MLGGGAFGCFDRTRTRTLYGHFALMRDCSGCAAKLLCAAPPLPPILRYGLQIHGRAAALHPAELGLLFGHNLVAVDPIEVAGSGPKNASAARFIAEELPGARNHRCFMSGAKRGDQSCAQSWRTGHFGEIGSGHFFGIIVPSLTFLPQNQVESGL